MSNPRKPRIAVIGSNMVDLVTYVNRMPVRGETVEAPSFEMGHGGKGANQAVAAAKLGASVMMVTKVGDDMFADNTVRNLAGFGVVESGDEMHERALAAAGVSHQGDARACVERHIHALQDGDATLRGHIALLQADDAEQRRRVLTDSKAASFASGCVIHRCATCRSGLSNQGARLLLPRYGAVSALSPQQSPA